MRPALIELRNFSFRYDSQAEPTLKGINLQIYEGEKILILGPSGSGKSTLGKLFNGLIPHAYEGEISGQAFLRGEDLCSQSISRLSYQVGTVLQDTSAQFVGLTVAEDVAFALENDQVASPELQERVTDWLNRLHLRTLAQQSPQELSGGQKQRVSMAGVLIDEPDILLFDEPLANLDPETGYQTMALIESIHQQSHKTILIIEHRLEDVLTQAVDRVLVFDGGQIVYDGDPQTLLASDQLRQVGIREPLYISAIRYARGGLEGVRQLDQLAAVTAPHLTEDLRHWIAQHPAPAPLVRETPLVRLDQVGFQYEGQPQPAVTDVSVTLYQGQMISIVGTNGAGKTTLAKLMAGFVTPTAGRIFWRDHEITAESIQARADRIGYVMQDPNAMLSQHLIYDEVALGLRLRGVEEATIETKVHQALQVCGLYPFRDWPVEALSFGQKKRVTIAAILVLEPELLILDEPTAGQDFRHYQEFMHFIQGLNQQGMTIVMITHDLQLMLEYTERTLVMDDGQLLADQAPFEVLTQPDLTARASLRPTSLYSLAQRLELGDATAFTRNFIAYEQALFARESAEGQVSDHG